MTRTEMIDRAVRSVDLDRLRALLPHTNDRERAFCRFCAATVRRVRDAFWIIEAKAQAEAAQARWRA